MEKSKDELGLGEILRESVGVWRNNPKFLIFALLASFPLFISLLAFEYLFQETLLESLRVLIAGRFYGDGGLSFAYVIHRFAFLGMTYSVLVHPLDLLNTISILCHSAGLYAGESLPSFREFLRRPVKEFREGPVITSAYVLALSALVAVGLISLATLFSLFLPSAGAGTVVLRDDSYYPSWVEVVTLSLRFGGPFLALLMKYIDWSSIWTVGVVISILEEDHGDGALRMAADLSKGNRRRGFLLMLVFFLWRLCLRSLCLYLVGRNKWGGAVRAAVTVVQALGVGSGNLMKWAAITVYYRDCKNRFLEKKVDGEASKQVV